MGSSHSSLEPRIQIHSSLEQPVRHRVLLPSQARLHSSQHSQQVTQACLARRLEPIHWVSRVHRRSASRLRHKVVFSIARLALQQEEPHLPIACLVQSLPSQLEVEYLPQEEPCRHRIQRQVVVCSLRIVRQSRPQAYSAILVRRLQVLNQAEAYSTARPVLVQVNQVCSTRLQDRLRQRTHCSRKARQAPRTSSVSLVPRPNLETSSARAVRIQRSQSQTACLRLLQPTRSSSPNRRSSTRLLSLKASSSLRASSLRLSNQALQASSQTSSSRSTSTRARIHLASNLAS